MSVGASISSPLTLVSALTHATAFMAIAIAIMHFGFAHQQQFKLVRAPTYLSTACARYCCVGLDTSESARHPLVPARVSPHVGAHVAVRSPAAHARAHGHCGDLHRVLRRASLCDDVGGHPGSVVPESV